MRTTALHDFFPAFFLPILILAIAPAYAQSTYKFEPLSIDQGLSHSWIGDIVQDEYGFIWIGTRGGLDRYDGYEVKSYYNTTNDTSTISNNWIKGLYNDLSDNLWIITSDGLDRMDLKSGKIYQYKYDPDNSNSINSNVVTDIFKDSSSKYWIGTNDGLCRLELSTGQIERYQQATPDTKSYLCNCEITTIFEDRAKDLWVGSDQGLYRFENEENKFTRFTHDSINPNSLSGNQISVIHEGQHGDLWIGTEDGGLNRLNPKNGNIDHYLYDPENHNSLSHPNVTTIYEDRNQILWIGTSGGGLNRLNSKTGKIDRYLHDPADPNSLTHNEIFDIKEDWQGNIWIGTPNGLNLITDPVNVKFQGFLPDPKDPNSIPFSYVSKIYPDKTGNLWLSSAYNEGVAKVDLINRPFIHYQHDPEDPNSLSDNDVYRIYQDKKDNVWVGTWTGGLNLLDRKTGKVTRFQHDPQDPYSIWGGTGIVGIFEDSQENFWLAVGGNSEGRLDLFDRSTGRFEHFQLHTGGRTNMGPILEDSHNNLWIGDIQGLYRLDRSTGQIEHFPPYTPGKNRNLYNYVEALLEDSEQNLWVGTLRGGLLRFDPVTKEFQPFRHDPSDPYSLSDNQVVVLHEDQKENLWIGTLGGGLNRMINSSGQFERFLEEDGLPSNFVVGILEDDHGNLWVSTTKGISCFNPENKTFRNYDMYDGLQGNHFEYGASFKDRKTGEFYFGGLNGLNIFHPDSIRIDTFAPQVSISSLIRFNRSSKDPILDHFISGKQSITVPYNENILTFSFAALNFRKTIKNQYKYQLSGFSDQWYNLGNKREVTFTDLHPGNYTLRVMAANSDDFWSHQPNELTINVLPPWWWSPWTKLTYLSLLLVTLYGFYRLLLNRKLTLIETRQLKALDAIKSKFYTNITHEFRTPLTVIQGLTDQAIEKQGALPSEKNLENARIIKRNSAQLLTMVNQMLDLRKLESGSLPVNLVKGDVLQYLCYLAESFYSYAADQRVGLHFMTDLDQLIIDYDEDKLLHIVSNLLSNAIKFTPEGGNVYFSVDTAQKSENLEVLQLRVKDTGIGIPEEKLPFIFDRFYQADQNATRKGEGSGIGLSLTRELVKLLKGELEVKSRVEQGTTFIVTLPISREADEAPAQQLLLEDKMLGFTAPKPFQTAPSNMPGKEEEIPLALVIEDNPDVVRYLSSCLEGAYKVVTALDGQTGVDTALDLVPDIIVSDVMMPNKDGFEVCDILKNDERTSHIPIILLTARADRASKIKGLRTGADAYLAKPFNREELKVRLEQLIEIRKKIQERYSSLQSPAEKDLRTLEDTFLDKVKKVVQEHISDSEFGLLEICRALGLSRSQLFRKLKALTGKSTSLVVRSIRLEQARKLLQNTDLNVSEVAYEVGFKDPSFFSRLFTEEYGEPPSTYRI